MVSIKIKTSKEKKIEAKRGEVYLILLKNNIFAKISKIT
ncbi:MAG: hypothetical protein MRERV_4c113 [Mycoplasmataceae bacterium RV_VA103A]|nr:MAG: hypothetical protein MRERV_4c113 [Mycoplasmataceae bacterium RV_VA103A]